MSILTRIFVIIILAGATIAGAHIYFDKGSEGVLPGSPQIVE